DGRPPSAGAGSAIGRADGTRPLSTCRRPFTGSGHNGSVGTYLLWDIDGTLIENDFTIVSVYAQAFELTVGTAPTAQIENPHGMTEAQLLREMLRIHGHDVSLHDTLIGHLDVVAARRHEEGVVRRPCAGVEAALTRFAELGWHNALLTGN